MLQRAGSRVQVAHNATGGWSRWAILSAAIEGVSPPDSTAMVSVEPVLIQIRFVSAFGSGADVSAPPQSR